jgi:transposase
MHQEPPLGWTRRPVDPLPTIWEVDDRLGSRIEPFLLEDAPTPSKSPGGRPRIDRRAALNAIIFRLRTACP